MTTELAIGSGDITKVGIGIIVALVVIGVLLSLVISAIVGRVIVLVVVVALAVLVWQQRDHVRDSYTKDRCNLGATFFGVHVDAPDSVRRACVSKAS